jgi:peptidoglycan/xylan/chitin deacetylase (PgdA/CDA1 family)
MIDGRKWRRRTVAFFIGLVLLCGTAWADQANIFVYHRFGDDRYPSTNISLEVFRQQLTFLKEDGYQVLPLSEVAKRLRLDKPLGEKTAVITVDDGYQSFLEGAVPLLREFGYPATLFVQAENVGGRGYLSWDELKEVRAAGVEIGNHSYSHLHMVSRRDGESREEWSARLRADIVRAQQAFRKNLDCEPDLFAYPYGEWSPEVVELIRDLGFKAAAVQTSGVVGPGSDVFRLPRFPMGGPYATLDGFREKARMKPLPVLSIVPENPVVGDANPPRLEIQIDPAAGIDAGRINLFIGGQPQGDVRVDPDNPSRIVVQAKNPLQGRRTQYTLTAQGPDGRWHWFGRLWLRPEVPE